MQNGKKSDLTPRQKEVLCLFSKGNTYEQIAYKLKISQYTVRAHLAIVRDKCGTTNSMSAFSIAISQGMMS